MKMLHKLAVVLITSTSLFSTTHANYHHAIFTVTNNSSFDVQLYRHRNDGWDRKASIIHTWPAHSPKTSKKFSLSYFGKYTLYAVPVGAKYGGVKNVDYTGVNAVAKSATFNAENHGHNDLSRENKVNCICSENGYVVTLSVKQSR